VVLALFIDDEKALLDSVKTAASLNNINLVTAQSWDDGIALVHVLAPDIVFADYNLPGSRHGLMLLLEIKRLRPSVKVWLVSAYLNDEDLSQIMELGVIDGAMKKLDPMATMEKLFELIRNTNSDAATGTDWVAFADAVVKFNDSQQDKLEAFDALLTNRLGSGP